MVPHKEVGEKITTKNKVQYLTSLLQIMMVEDLGRLNEPNVEVEDTGLVRRLPVLTTHFLNPLSTRLKREQESDIARKLASTDEPWLTKLHAEWVGKVLYDGGYYRVVDILYVHNKGNNRYPCWEATSEPVYLHNGEFVVHDRNVTLASNGTRVTLKSSLVGFALAEYSNGDKEEPVCLPFAAERHARFLQR